MELLISTVLASLYALIQNAAAGMLTSRVIEPGLEHASSRAVSIVRSQLISRRKRAENAHILNMTLGYIDIYYEDRGWGFICDTEGNRHYFSGGRFRANGVPTEGRFVRFRSIAPKKPGNCPKATTVLLDPERLDACYIGKKPRRVTAQAVCYECGKQMTPNSQGNCPFCGQRFKLPRYLGFSLSDKKRPQDKSTVARNA